MKAIVLRGVKEPLVLCDVPVPQVGPNEALVRVHAAAFNRRDWWIQQGQYAGLKFPIILGSDGAGVVEAVGVEADAAWVGQPVIINPSINWGTSEAVQQPGFSILGLPQDGTFADYVRVPVENLFKKPSHLSFAEAAAIPLAGLTAYRALFSRGRLEAGENVLIVGVGGGVASFALQWAVQAGARVYVTSGSRAKIEQALKRGAVGGGLYTDENWAQQLRDVSGGFDVIVDSALGDGFAHHMDLAKPGGRIVFFGGTAGNLPPLNARKIFWKQLAILGSTMGSPRDFDRMLHFVNEYHLTPVVDHIYPFAEAETAIREMDHSTQFGKIVLELVSDESRPQA